MNEQEVLAPAEIEADFAIRCCDDSMMNVRLFSGDLVFIRACDRVESGQIAAVRIGEEYILRRVYCGDGYLYLAAENPLFESITVSTPDDNIEIIGVAVKALCNVF